MKIRLTPHPRDGFNVDTAHGRYLVQTFTVSISNVRCAPCVSSIMAFGVPAYDRPAPGHVQISNALPEEQAVRAWTSGFDVPEFEPGDTAPLALLVRELLLTGAAITIREDDGLHPMTGEGMLATM